MSPLWCFKVSPVRPALLTDDVLLLVPVLPSLFPSDPPVLAGQDVDHPCGVLASPQISCACRTSYCPVNHMSWMPAESCHTEVEGEGRHIPLRLPCPPLPLLLILTWYSATLGLGLACGFFPWLHPPGWMPILWHLPQMGYVQTGWSFPFEAFGIRPRGNEEGESGI